MFQPQKENMTANTSTHLDSKGRPHVQVSNNAVQSAPLVPTSYSCVHFAQLAPQTKEIHVDGLGRKTSNSEISPNPFIP